jgi:transposase
MRKIFEVLRLSVADGRSHREIARAIIASPTTVGEILRRGETGRIDLSATGRHV